MSESDIKRLVDGVEDADEETIREILADEIEQMDGDETHPQDRIVQSMMAMDSALSDIKYTIQEILSDEETYAVYLTVSGTFTAPWEFPHPETGEQVTVEPTEEDVSGSAVYLMRFDNGELVELANFGYTEMMMDMGVYEFSVEDGEETAEA